MERMSEDKSRVVYGVALLVLGITSLIITPLWHAFVAVIAAGLIIELTYRFLTRGDFWNLHYYFLLLANGAAGCWEMYHLRTADNGFAKIIVFAVMTMVSDTAAWYAGKRLRWWGRWGDKHPFPNVSPKKTNRGFLAGGLISASVGIITILIMSIWIDWGGEFHRVLVTAALIPILAPMGDLLESQAKRKLNIKDMSKVLGRGHGGLWDRFDALVTAFTTSKLVSWF